MKKLLLIIVILFSAAALFARLSTLNQSLILLTKIGNEQFVADKVISIGELTKSKLNEFSSLFESKYIWVELNMEDDFSIEINEQLAEILINNLLSNAIKHNTEKGKIQLAIRKNEFKICNSGKSNSLTDHYFKDELHCFTITPKVKN